MTRNATNFPTAVKLFFKNYTNFSGRSSRSAYWWWILASFLISIPVEIMDAMILGDAYYQSDFGPVSAIVTLLTLVPGISLSVRRLHDVGKSGWWILISLTVIGIIPLFVWAVREGNDGANTFGEDVEAGL